jgi:hypothetical protein
MSKVIYVDFRQQVEEEPLTCICGSKLFTLYSYEAECHFCDRTYSYTNNDPKGAA